MVSDSSKGDSDQDHVWVSVCVDARVFNVLDTVHGLKKEKKKRMCDNVSQF